MIRTEWQAETDLFYAPAPFKWSPASEAANRARCLAEDLDTARAEYVMRRAHIATANRCTYSRAASKRMAFQLLNKARAALLKAERNVL